jgi:hypothetical protein
MTTEQPPSTDRSLPARVFIGAVMALIAVVLLRWVAITVLGTLRFVLILIAIAAAVLWAITAKANR